jgi:methylmalonyl-CoA/ethylmalonyl-CoA epimerase
VRLLFEQQAASATLYFRVEDLSAAYAALRDRGVSLVGEPHMIYRDDAGQFGKAGEEEWMTFLRDPAGNLVGLTQRKSGA